MNLAQIWFDDIATTFTVVSSVAFQPMPGSTAFIGVTNNVNGFQPQKANITSARIIVGNEGQGVSNAHWSASFTGNQGNNTYHIAMFRNGTKLGETSKERKLGTAGDIGSANGDAYAVFHTNDIIDIRANAGGTTGVKVTFNHCNFGLELLDTSTILSTVV